VGPGHRLRIRGSHDDGRAVAVDGALQARGRTVRHRHHLLLPPLRRESGFVLVVAHPFILLTTDPALLFYLNPLEAPWFMTVGVLSVGALTIVMVTSLWRTAMGLSYDAWRIAHSVLAVAAVVLALTHMYSVGFYVSDPWTRRLWTIIAVSWLTGRTTPFGTAADDRFIASASARVARFTTAIWRTPVSL
jgi:predicted ferric reductase